MAAATVVRRDSAAAGLALADSFIRANPGEQIFMLDVDDALGRPSAAGIHVISLDAIGLDHRTIHQAALYLDESGFVAWLRPLFLLHLLEDHEVVLWLDPWSLVLHEVRDLARLTFTHGATVVARAPRPMPRDGLQPADSALSHDGVISTSLFAVAREARPMLHWWASCAADDTDGTPWLDHAIGRFPCLVLKDDGLVVGSWSIGADLVGSMDLVGPEKGTLTLRGSRVRQLDLSGFDPERPWLLDTDQLPRPRVLLSEQPNLAALCRIHASEVLRHATALPPGSGSRFSRLAAGPSVNHHLRQVYRAAVAPAQRDPTLLPPDPFDKAAADDFLGWLMEPVEASPVVRLSRYLWQIYLERPDVRAAIPGLPETNVWAFVNWAKQFGREHPGFDADLVDQSVRLAGAEPAPAPGTLRARQPGVNVVGYLRGELGIGESARLMLSALSAAGIPHATASVDRHLQSRQGSSYAEGPTRPPYDTTLLCVNADMTPTVAASVPSLLAPSYRIGMWYWEVEEFPASQHEGFDHVDEVWVATDFVRNAIEAKSPVPVRTITPPLPQPSIAPERTRDQLGLPEGRPLFLFMFDYLSTMERKNPLGLVDAFQAAFSPGDGPLLVIKSINAVRRPDPAEQLRLRVAGASNVLLLESYLNADNRDALMGMCDCYVSLHRSEGLGLTMAEAMAFGKPVIATGYSGNLQFMTEANSFLVPWTPTEIPTGCEPYPVGGVWAEPDLDVAAGLMRSVLEDGKVAHSRASQGAVDFRTLHSPEVAGRRISARLAELAELHPAPRRPGPRDQVRALVRKARRG